MTPTFSDFFKSFYYSTTYLQPVDLSEQRLSECLLETENQETAEKAQQLISNPEVQKALSEPLSYDLVKEVPEKNAILQKHGFTLLSSKSNLTGKKMPYYSVIEHDELQGWVIKSGATRVPENQIMIGPMNDRNEMAFFTKEESILRLSMAERIAKVAKESNIEVIVPNKKLVSYQNVAGVTDVTRKYCVLSEKVNVLSVADTIETIKQMDAKKQKEEARKICKIVKKAGIVDASFDNIRYTPNGMRTIIDTEPAGLMVAKRGGLWNKFFGNKGACVEKCARIGLFVLMTQAKINGLEEFHKKVKNEYEKVTSPKLSNRKIALSALSLGLIPLINVIVALVKTKLTKQSFAKLQKMDKQHTKKIQEYMNKKMQDLSNLSLCTLSQEKQQEIIEKIQSLKASIPNKEFVKNHLKKRLPISQRFFAYTEGVPYKSGLAFQLV